MSGLAHRIMPERARMGGLHTRGFTLIEMLGVVAIILILASLILGVGKYAKNKAARSKAESQLARFEAGCHRYMGDKAIYPENLSAASMDYSGTATLDPWGNSWRYRIMDNSRQFVIGSFGPDMKPGVANYDDDRYDLNHPWRSNGVDVTLWTEFGYGDDIVMGDTTKKIWFEP